MARQTDVSAVRQASGTSRSVSIPIQFPIGRRRFTSHQRLAQTFAFPVADRRVVGGSMGIENKTPFEELETVLTRLKLEW